MNSFFSSNLKHLRTSNGMEQRELAETLGFKSSSAVSEWEKGVREPSVVVISKIAEIFRVSISDIMEKDLSSARFSNISNNSSSNQIPLLGTIAAGSPILAEQNIEDYFNLDKKIKADFCLRIKGDSMINVNILDGDIVFIKKQDDLEDGQIGAVLVDDSATLKRFYRENGSVILQSENSTYKPMVISKGDVKILGKMVASLRQYK